MGNLSKNLNSIHIKKIYLKIWRIADGDKNTIPDDKIHHASTILSEINMTDISFFSAHQFIEGQSVVIEFQIPKTFSVHVEVSYCRNYSMKNQLISNKRLPFRGRAHFTFPHPREKILLREFVSSIEPPDANNSDSPFAISSPSELKKAS